MELTAPADLLTSRQCPLFPTTRRRGHRPSGFSAGTWREEPGRWFLSRYLIFLLASLETLTCGPGVLWAFSFPGALRASP